MSNLCSCPVQLIIPLPLGILMQLMSNTGVNVSYDVPIRDVFPVEGLPAWMNILVKINPATYSIVPIRQVILGVAPDYPFSISLLGHTMSLWDNIIVMAVFGIVMTFLAMWSFGKQE